MNYVDPLLMVNSKKTCPVCNGEKPAKKACLDCGKSGYVPIDLSGLWDTMSGFLVCGGPSINKLPFHFLRDRGIASLGINNAAGHVPCSAWCFSDPQEKFHHGLYLDPNIMTFAPIPKLSKRIKVKREGKIDWVETRVQECPNTFGFDRKTSMYPGEFLTTPYAQWGYGGKQPENERPFTCLSTMLLGIRLMCYLGCKRIYMLGVDFWRDENEQYAFPQKAALVNGRYDKESAMLESIKPVLEGRGIEVYNCNAESKCKVFNYVSFDEALIDCRGNVPREPFDLAGWYEKDERDKKPDKT